jgi:hypothetical protein
MSSSNDARSLGEASQKREPSRLAAEATVWRSAQKNRPASATVVTRDGRLVPVTFKGKHMSSTRAISKYFR